MENSAKYENSNIYQFSREQYLEKPLPSSADAERAVLGAVLLDNSILPQAIEYLQPEHFYSPAYRRIYSAMITLFERKEKIDPIFLGEEIKKTGSLESIGGIAAISNLTYGLPHFSDITEYCLLVRGKKSIRDLIRTCNSITSTALAEDDLPEDVLNFAQTEINRVCTQEDKKGLESLARIGLNRLAHIQEIAKKGEYFTGLRTGFRDWDEITGGLQKTDLIIIAARPGMGKSSLVGNIAEKVSFHLPEAVTAIFSLEMSKEQYTDRMLCSSGKVDLQRFRKGYLTKEEWGSLAFTVDTFSNYRIKIDDTSAISPLEIRSKLLRLQAEYKRLDLVIVDYLQRMVSSKRSESRQQEVSSIARDLKSIAKDFCVPVIAVSSLSRECEKRNPPRPRMSDLRESGDIESEADMVGFIYRPEYYNETEENTGVAEFIIDKNRHGPTKTIKFAFMKEFTKFANYFNG